jgi:V8-like Glu-specific endopeptidase
MKSLFLLLIISANSQAGIQAIYGQDNRTDVYASTNSLFVELAKSTAAMIDKTHIKKMNAESIISAPSLGEMYRLCPEERFRHQPTAANCSGTLVAPDVIMTAAHCYDLAKQTCKESVWVFDYKVNKENQSTVTVSNDKIYECSEVILKQMDLNQGIDHALIKLKRVVNDRPHARIRSNGDIKMGEPLVLIGHPSGLPTKIAPDASVLKTLTNSFVSNVDAFSVNSGSGVFHAITGEIEGILSSGRQDYDGKGNCTSVMIYEMSEGNETVVKPNLVSAFLKSYKMKSSPFRRVFKKRSTN